MQLGRAISYNYTFNVVNGIANLIGFLAVAISSFFAIYAFVDVLILTNNFNNVQDDVNSIALTTTGGAISLVSGPLSIKTIKADGQISIFDNGECLTLQVNETAGPNGTLISIGPGVPLTPGGLDLYSLEASGLATVNLTAPTVTIGVDPSDVINLVEQNVTLNDVSTALPLTPGGLDLYGIEAGNGTSIFLSGTNYVIEINGTLTNAGTGAGVAQTGFNLRSFVSGFGITIVEDTDEINISSVGLTTVGGGVSIVDTGFDVRSLVAGTGIFISFTSDEVTIGTNISEIGGNLSLTQLGSGLALTPGALDLKSFVYTSSFLTSASPSEVFVGLNYSELQVNLIITSVGTGEEFTIGSTGLELKTLTSTSGTLIITSTADEVNVEANVSAIANVSLVQLGGGEPLTPGGLDLKSLTSIGGSIIFTSSSTEINAEVNASLVPLGTGEILTASGLDVKSITSNDGSIFLTPSANELDFGLNFSTISSNLSLGTVGTGETLTAGGLDIKSITSDDGSIIFTPSANELDLSVNLTITSNISVESVGPGESLAAGGTDIKSVVGVNGIDVTSNSTTVTISPSLVLDSGVSTTAVVEFSNINVGSSFLVLGTAHYQRVGSVVTFGGLFGNLTMQNPSFPFQITAEVSTMGFPTAISSTIVGTCGCATPLTFIGYGGAAVYPCAVDGDGGNIRSAGALVDSPEYDNCDLSFVGSYVTSDP